MARQVIITYDNLDKAAERLAAMIQATDWSKAEQSFKLGYHRRILELMSLIGLEVTIAETPKEYKQPVLLDELPQHLQRVADAHRRIRG